jgi:pimeloyl-ACP methyl ester carboxylesterase
MTSLPRWQTGTVDSGGEEIYYELVERDPSLPTIVLTHGAGGMHTVWFQQVVALADEYRVVTWDARGFGNSTYRTGTHGAQASSADLGAVLDATGTDRAHLVGQSMGGWWVTTFALAHPTRVRSLTLTNTVGGLWTDDLYAHFTEYARNARPDPPVVGGHPALGTTSGSHAFLYQQLNTFHSPPLADVLPALVGTRYAHDDVRALGIPVLVITGSEDPIFAAPYIRRSAELLGAEIVEIEGAGHSPYWERPAEFNAALTSFVARADALAQGTVAELE